MSNGGFEEWFGRASSITLNHFVVYGMKDSKDSIIYIGVTSLHGFIARMRQHYYEKTWVKDEVHGCEILEEYSSRESAIKAEIRLIRSLHPAYNVQDRVDQKRSDAQVEFTPGLNEVKDSLGNTAKRWGVSEYVVRWCIKHRMAKVTQDSEILHLRTMIIAPRELPEIVRNKLNISKIPA